MYAVEATKDRSYSIELFPCLRGWCDLDGFDNSFISIRVPLSDSVL